MAISLVSTKERPVPVEHQSNFNHLIFDIAWFGVLNGTAIAFVAVYATRLGASAFQLGLLNASPAVINLLFALPAGRWLQNRPISRATFLSASLHRWFYLLWVFLPFLFAPQGQIWAIILLTVLMTIPGTALAVGFNGLFAAAVPSEWRPQVVGIRNAAYALTSIIVTLFAGWLLDVMPFPTGYQIVFLIGFIGAVMSTVHLWFIRPADEFRKPRKGVSTGDWAQPGAMSLWHSLRTTVGLRFLVRANPLSGRWFTPVREHSYRNVLWAVFAMHLVLYLGVPIFPLFLVRELALTDQIIGLGNSIFYVALFLASTQLHTVSRRFDNRHTMALGIMIMSLYPFIVSQAAGPALFLVASVLGGVGWALAGGAVGNYVLEKTPEENRSFYLAWNNISLQAGVLIGALVAPILANWWGLALALVFAAAARFLTGLIIFRQR